MMTCKEIDVARALLINLPRVRGFTVDKKRGSFQDLMLIVELEPNGPWTPSVFNRYCVINTLEETRELARKLLGIE